MLPKVSEAYSRHYSRYLQKVADVTSKMQTRCEKCNISGVLVFGIKEFVLTESPFKEQLLIETHPRVVL